MKRRIERYTEIAVVEDNAAANQALKNRTTLVIIHRGRPRWLKFHCPCGCSDILSINLDHKTGAFWYLQQDQDGLSLSPSVWRTSNCQTHFFLIANNVQFCSPFQISSPVQISWWREFLGRISISKRIGKWRRGIS